MTDDLRSRFLERAIVDPTTECVVWAGAKSNGGYGQTGDRTKKVAAHRVAYELFVGPIPEGMVLDHLCRNRLCVRPDHLEPVTNRENILRGVGASAKAAQATHCPAGHPYDEENTYRRREGWRACWTCLRATRQASQRRAREARPLTR